MTKITKLQIENVKRISAVEIAPDGSVVVVGGRNAQGKSSVLDAIAYALGGSKLVCEAPVRQGQSRAKIEVTLDDGLRVGRGEECHVVIEDGAVARDAEPQQRLL